MNFLKILKESVQGLLHNKRRTGLTMLGLIIGIVAVILVLSVGAGAQSLITNQIKTQGTDLIAILAGASDEKGPPASVMGIVVTTLTYEDGKALLNKNNVEHLKEFAAYVSGNDVLAWRNHERSVTYTGTTPSYQEIEKVQVGNGRFFSIGELDGGEHVMVLGDEIATEIFGNQDPVGQSVKLKKKHFKVVGVLKPQGSTGFEDPDNAVLIPLTVAQRELLGIRHVSFLRARAEAEEYVPETIEQIKQTLRERHDDEDFSIRNTADLLQILTTVTDALKFFLAAVAAISLFVGGVGIMNIMLISVKEKTREIGLRKSVGARKRDIMLQFLSETVFLALIAGIIGIVIGVLISFGIAKIVQSLGYDYSFILTFESIVLACVVSIGIGLVFGIAPARHAAKLNPIDALRYE